MPEKHIIPADQILPNKLPLLKLDGKPIFPGIFTPLMIRDEDDLELVNQAMSGNNMLGLILVKEDEEATGSPNGIYSVGTAAKIMKKINLPDGGFNIFVSTLKRFKVKKILNRTTPVLAAVEYLEETDDTEIMQPFLFAYGIDYGL